MSQFLVKDEKKQKKKDIDEMNVEDLLEESDSDDSEDDDLSGDPDLEKFKQKAGLTSSTLSNKYGSNKITSTSGSTISSTIGNTTTANSLLGNSILKSDIPRSNLQQQQNQFTLQSVKTNANLQQSAMNNAKMTQEEKIRAALELQLSSDSHDSSDEELEKILAQSTVGSKHKKAVGNMGSANLINTTSGNSMLSTLSQDSNVKKGGNNIRQSDDLNALISGDGGLSHSGLNSNKYLQNISNMDILDIVEKNERMNEVGPEKELQHASQLLSFDKKFYNVQKKLFTYQEFKDIAKKLHQQKNHQFGGMVSAITVVQDYIFIGNSSGIIRVFDMKSQREMKPLMDEREIGQNKVTSLDISDDGGFLISGYKKGQVALWDLINYKLLKLISDIHQSDVINAKIYHQDDSENLYAVSCEDSGKVQLIRYNKKSFLGGYSSEAQFLFKTRLKGTATLSVQKNSLIAFGSLNEIVVCSMRPIKEIFQINRPNFCKEKSIPYIDWGYGLTPSHRERTVPIMAFAWDRLIQLVYINEETSTVEMDGFYYSDQEINTLFFMGDSILFVLVNGREVKVLYTTKFHPGHFKFLENAKKDDLLNNPFEKVISVTSHSELEKGFEQPDIKSNLLQCQMVMNYNQSVRKYKSTIFFMCGKTLVKGKLFTWKEYLDHIKFNENNDWLNVLKVALEIFNGETKGFAKVPDEKEIREGILKGFMKDMIKESIQQVIYKFVNANKGNAINQANSIAQTANYQADSIAIKVAIEFCLSINAIFFLFSEIYSVFQEQGLENKFIMNLEPFILSGQFKKEIIPEHIITRMIQYYEDKKSYKVLEKVIQQLDLSDYSQKEDLIVTCEVNCLISALLYLMSSQSEDNLGCMQILNRMLKVMTEAKDIDISKEDIAMIKKFESMRKYEIEKSRSYIGYKLFWILKLFIDGRSYPTGYLTNEKHRIHVYDIVNFITNDYVLDELLQFDSEQFFKVVARLYQGIPFKFLEEQQDYLIRNPVKGVGMSMTPNKVINQLFLKKCEGNEIRLEHYYKFLVYVQAQHEYQKLESDPFLFIDKDLLLKAILQIIIAAGKREISNDEEQLLIKAIENKKFKDADIEKMLQQLDLQIRALPSLRIFLVEKKKDYVQSFRLNMANQALRRNIFEWINKTLSKLQQQQNSDKQQSLSTQNTSLQQNQTKILLLDNDVNSSPFNKLKEAVQKSVRELIAINDAECVALLDRWFEDSYQEQLILEELADYPEIQFNYVKRFINQNEEKIKQTIAEATYSSQKKSEAQRYVEYLVLHTKLLCKYQRDEVHEYVKKDYYPVQECLEICKQEKITRAVAELLRRNGNFLESLQTYLEIIDNLDRNELMQELYQNSKHLNTNVISNTAATSTAKLLQKTHQSSSQGGNKYPFEFLNCQKLPTIHEFDIFLDKALKIADKQQNIVGEEGWFTILEFLSQYSQELQSKIFPLTNNSNQQILKTKDKQKLDNLKEFVTQRKNMVLRMVPTTISLQTLTQRLNLDFKQIKDLYDYKVKAVRNNEKYLKLAKSLQEKELLTLSKQLNAEINRGFNLKDDERCDMCRLTLQLAIQKVPLRLFKCSHNYHLNCLKELQCPRCVKKTLEIESKDQQKRARAATLRKDSQTADQLNSSAGKENQKERNMAFMQAQAEAALNQSPDKIMQQQYQQLGNVLYIKRLEVFDQQQEHLGLSKASFN